MEKQKAPAPIVLLTDFGTTDVYAGVMKGVIAGISPRTPVLDLTHEIRPQQVREGACALLFSYRFFPSRTVFCCVVDPGVGTARAPVAVEIGSEEESIICVAPDNGLLTPLLERARRAVTLDDAGYFLPVVSKTFHGRDVFAPVAAHLAAGADLGEVGSALATSRLVRLDWPQPSRIAGGWRAEVIHVDHFGNLVTNLEGEPSLEPGASWEVEVAGRSVAQVRTTFADVEVGALVAYLGSSGYLEVGVRQGNASAQLGVGWGDPVVVRRIGD